MTRIPNVEGLYERLWEELIKPCKRCRGTGSIIQDDADDLFATSAVDCECKVEVSFRVAQLEACVPREFWDVERIDFKYNRRPFEVVKTYSEDLEAVRKTGSGLFLHGENGAGKTACATYVLNKALRAGYSGHYTTAHVLMNTIMAAWRDSFLADWFWYRMDADFLVIDEMGKEYRGSGSERVLSEMDALIRKRRGNLQPLILVTNHTRQQWQEDYGASLWSCVVDRVRPIQFDPEDYRVQSSKFGS